MGNLNFWLHHKGSQPAQMNFYADLITQFKIAQVLSSWLMICSSTRIRYKDYAQT